MFDVLIESEPAGRHLRRNLPNTLLSIGLHAALACAAVKATMKPPRDPEAPVVQIDIGYPRQRPSDPTPPPPPPTIRAVVAPAQVPTSIPPIDPGALFDPREYQGVGVDSGVAGPEATSPVDPAAVFVTERVDQPPVGLSFPRPAYPRILLEAGVEGTVVLEAIIDTAGRAEPGSIKVSSSTHRAFEASAREAMRRALFRPGRIRGRPVRVLVHLPLRFVLPRREP